MFVRRLELVDFRSYGRCELDFRAATTVLVGANAHGKTNLLEALVRAASGSSHRVSTDRPLVRAGCDAAYVRCDLETDGGRSRRVDTELRPGQGTRVRVDGQDVQRTSDALGVLRVVLFAPEDLAILRGGPGRRRRFLDDLLVQRRAAHAATRSEYRRVVRQRNQLLKSARRFGRDGQARRRARRSLEVWTDQLVRYGASLTAARIAAVQALSGPVNRFYGLIAAHEEPIELVYESSSGLRVSAGRDGEVPDTADIASRLATALEHHESEELDRGVTLVGPHRDDIAFSVKGLPARDYASHGQLWSLTLGLRLATYEVLAEVGDRPVVLLDDVFAELDQDRRRRLAEACAEREQVVVTAAVEADVPLAGDLVDVRLVDGVSQASHRDGPAGLGAVS